jgi:hypothetical protein
MDYVRIMVFELRHTYILRCEYFEELCFFPNSHEKSKDWSLKKLLSVHKITYFHQWQELKMHLINTVIYYMRHNVWYWSRIFCLVTVFIYMPLQRIYLRKSRKTSLQLCSLNVFIILSSWTIILVIEVFESLMYITRRTNYVGVEYNVSEVCHHYRIREIAIISWREAPSMCRQMMFVKLSATIIVYVTVQVSFVVSYLRLSQRWQWRVLSSGVWRHVVWYNFTNFSKRTLVFLTAYILMATCLVYLSTLKIETLCFSETSMNFYWTIKCYIWDGTILHILYC